MNQPPPESRLQIARASILRQAGGTLSVRDVSTHLGISEELVRREIEKGAILAVCPDPGGELRIPRAQLGGKGLLTGLGEVLEAMHVRDPWMRVQLLLDHDVIGPLRAGRVEDAVRAVRSYLPRDEGEPRR